MRRELLPKRTAFNGDSLTNSGNFLDTFWNGQILSLPNDPERFASVLLDSKVSNGQTVNNLFDFWIA